MYILKFTQLFRKYLSHISATFYSDNSVLNEAIKIPSVHHFLIICRCKVVNHLCLRQIACLFVDILSQRSADIYRC